MKQFLRSCCGRDQRDLDALRVVLQVVHTLAVDMSTALEREKEIGTKNYEATILCLFTSVQSSLLACSLALASVGEKQTRSVDKVLLGQVLPDQVPTRAPGDAALSSATFCIRPRLSVDHVVRQHVDSHGQAPQPPDIIARTFQGPPCVKL